MKPRAESGFNKLNLILKIENILFLMEFLFQTGFTQLNK